MKYAAATNYDECLVMWDTAPDVAPERGPHMPTDVGIPLCSAEIFPRLLCELYGLRMAAEIINADDCCRCRAYG
jgi:hypothetical protein